MNIEEIYNTYFKDIYLFIYSICKTEDLAQDITQDTFVKAMKNLDKFDGKKDIKAWLFTIAKNTYYTHYNKNKKISNSEIIENSATQENTTLDNYIIKEQVIEIQKALNNIGELYKEVFMLKFYAEVSYENIAEIFGKSSRWARVIFFRAKKQILEQMEGL